MFGELYEKRGVKKMKIIVKAFLKEDTLREGPCGYAETSLMSGSYDNRILKSLKKRAREELKKMVKLKRGERVKYQVKIKM